MASAGLLPLLPSYYNHPFMLNLAGSRNRSGQIVALLVVMAAALFAVGCGDVYRPVANPQLLPGGDPQAIHFAFVLNNNNGGLGTVSQIDMSGDSNQANHGVGRNPVHAVVQPATDSVFVANQGDDTVSTFSTLSLIAPSTITLPAGAAPSFMAIAGTARAFAVTPGTNPPSVTEINTGINVVIATIPVGNGPVMAVATRDGGKVYVLNRADNTVSVISVANAVVTKTIAVGISPTWAVMSGDGATLWVMNQGSDNVSVIDTASDSVSQSIAVGVAPRSAVFESRLLRLYVANAGSNSITVIDATNQSVLGTVAVGAAPVSLTALQDGTKIYVANSGCQDVIALQSCNGNTVSVVSANSLSVVKTITVGSTPVSVDSAFDVSKVVVANRDSNNISNIRTSDDTVVTTLPSGSPAPVWVAVL